MIEQNMEVEVDSDSLGPDVLERIHNFKHNNAPRFGELLCDSPKYLRGCLIGSLIEEMLNKAQGNTDYQPLFSESEAQSFWSIYDMNLKAHALYDALGSSFLGETSDNQLKYIKSKLIETFTQYGNFIRSFLNVNKNQLSKEVIEILTNAQLLAVDLTERTQILEYESIIRPKPLNLRKIIIQAFDYYNNHRAPGVSPIMVDFHIPDELRESLIYVDGDLFRTEFIDNIIRNLNDHAFKGYDNVNIKFKDDFKPRYKNIFVHAKDILLKILTNGHDNEDKYEEDKYIISGLKEKRVLITFSKGLNDDMLLEIKNNGLPFTGDCQAVFNRGVGAGTGIGLACAKKFIEDCGGNISMFTSPEEYKVGLKINIPIYKNGKI